jgi:Flp pilus assembly protein TadD
MRGIVVVLGVVASIGCGARQAPDREAEGGALRAELAELYVAKGAREAAAPLLRRAIAEHPKDARLRVLYGRVLRDLGLLPQAERELRLAVRLAPRRADAHAALAILLDLTGRGREALAAHARAVRLEPGDAALRNNLGFSLMTAGRPAEAIGPLEAALALDPGLGQAYANLGFAYGRAGRMVDAERTFRAGLGEAAAIYNLSLIHEEAGDAAKAEALRAEAFALDPALRPEEVVR